jgi:transcriptional regulator with XRE-family HTH domain
VEDACVIANRLGEYLRVRRGQVTPADVGLPVTGRRRVPGLRRDEVAELVGLSADYYVRLEQGRANRPSDEVLDALSRALMLGPAERAHLYDLARPPRRTKLAAASFERMASLRAALRQVVESIPTTPAVVMNDRSDVLAWNHLAAVLIADFPRLAADERNMARRIFLDPDAKQVHPDWNEAARTTVGILRMAAGRQPHDPRLVRLIGELSLNSDTFRTLWASYHVHEKTHGRKRFHHPAVGDVALDYQSFLVPGPARHVLVIYSAAPGSPAEQALNFLGSFTAPHPPSPARG